MRHERYAEYSTIAQDLVQIVKTYKTSPMIIKCDLNEIDENKAQEIANVLSKIGYAG